MVPLGRPVKVSLYIIDLQVATMFPLSSLLSVYFCTQLVLALVRVVVVGGVHTCQPCFTISHLEMESCISCRISDLMAKEMLKC